MNRITTFIILILISGAAITGCKKDQNPKLPSDMKKGAIPLVKIDAGSNDSIFNVATFQGKFSVGLYFANDERPKKMDVVVIFNGDKTKVKTLKADVTTYPTSITVTAEQLAALFGITVGNLKTGDVFKIGADVYMNSGLVVPIFNPFGNSYTAEVNSYAGSSLNVTYPVKLKP
ncbi:hypothetical protein ACTJJ0_07410 [Chitinophaga sp. 22321]|uniref:Uncharacterized protein n=1 Tax=Chitinophaga hostae TaxID=2831022 RepID=A0ABS5IT97_9BACT|nr:hypothetical protein [Chitinophaga hostae]MBS0026183.1 hypothetical protein [Chitinophaga hostae]